MKPVTIINRGDEFVTLRATTDRPAEIREALAARDVQQVYKGDQNQAWDAVLSNHCLARALDQSDTPVTFFVQDERLGTADSRLARLQRDQGRSYGLTEDYYRGASGAVWEHQDLSFGLFYTEPISPGQFARAGLHLGRLADGWSRHSQVCLADGDWKLALASLGVTLPGEGAADGATRLGGAADEALAALAQQDPASAIFYSFTRSEGLYGIVPLRDENVTLSSIPADHPELMALARRLLVQVGARGAMRQAGARGVRRGIATRVRALADWAGLFLKENPGASVACFQQGLGEWLCRQTFPLRPATLTRASTLASVRRGECDRLKDPASTLHYFLHLALQHPAEFVDAYNDALNAVGLGLQRLKWEPDSGRLTLPFYAEFAPPGGDGRTYRFGLELAGLGSCEIRLDNPAVGPLIVPVNEPPSTVEALADALFAGLPEVDEVVLLGKAAPFAAELQRAPRGLGLPRQGSRYTPMVDHLLAGLRSRGALRRPTGLLIRIGLNALDRLTACGEMPLQLPSFLAPVMGNQTTCARLARSWRPVARSAERLLRRLERLDFGRQVHLLPLLARLRLGWSPDGGCWRRRERNLLESLGGEEMLPQLQELARELPDAAARVIERLAERRNELLGLRRRAAMSARRSPRGRLLPEIPQTEIDEREQVEIRLLMLYGALVRRLWQRAESLPYLNDRPYTLALYMMFGNDLFPAICRQVEFDVEYISTTGFPVAGEADQADVRGNPV